MDEVLVDNGDITLRVEVTGEGPTILCVHGWPELPRSWRHQVAHFSERGYKVAAMNVRGYGGSSAPAEIERYTLRELAGDAAAVAAALDDEPVVLFGHDWGAPIAWHTAVRHPDRVRAVAGLSVPHAPPTPLSLIDVFDQLYADRFFYMLAFQEPGRIESQFAADTRGALKRVYFGGSGDAPANSLLGDAPRDTEFLSVLGDPPDDPSRLIAGERDVVRAMVPGVDRFADPGSGCTDFRGSTIIPGIGHWVQQEAPDAVNAALDAFLASL